MKALFIGGTGQISHSCVHEALRRGIGVTIFNRGTRPDSLPAEVERIQGSLNDATYRQLGQRGFDVVCQFFAFLPGQIEQDIAVFGGNTGQYVFISSASAYQKPARIFPITEAVPLDNPFWQYSRDKAACERLLAGQSAVPYTIVRPSHTVRTGLPLPFAGGTVLARIKAGKPLVVHGDGTTFWTLTRSQDFAVPFTGLFGKKTALGEAFHITSDLAWTFDDIHETVARMLGHKAKLVHVASETLARYRPESYGPIVGDLSHSLIFDNSKVRRVAGDFSCVRTLAEVLEEPLRHALQQPPDPAIDALLHRIVADVESLPR